MNLKLNNNLYISIGKSITKFARFEQDKIQNESIIKIETQKLIEFSDINKLLDDIYSKFDCKNKKKCIKKVFICSVVYELNERFKNLFKKNDIEVVFLSNENQFSLDLSNLYNPWELGADIIAQSIYVTHFFNEAIVVSLGTITAIYYLKNNIFQGCILMPGVKTSLNDFESILKIKLNQISIQNKTLGLNSHESICIGILNSIKNEVDNLVHKLKIKCPIIFSGGNSEYFDSLNWWHVDNLDLLGLYIYSKKLKSGNLK